MQHLLCTEYNAWCRTYNYYNHSIISTQFLVQSEMNRQCFINGPQQILISCDILKGICIIGNISLSKSMNF